MGHDASANRELVRRALTEAFIDKDASAIRPVPGGPGDGRLVEHWEVMQPAVAQTVSGNPMLTHA